MRVFYNIKKQNGNECTELEGGLNATHNRITKAAFTSIECQCLERWLNENENLHNKIERARERERLNYGIWNRIEVRWFMYNVYAFSTGFLDGNAKKFKSQQQMLEKTKKKVILYLMYVYRKNFNFGERNWKKEKLQTMPKKTLNIRWKKIQRKKCRFKIYLMKKDLKNDEFISIHFRIEIKKINKKRFALNTFHSVVVCLWLVAFTFYLNTIISRAPFR